MSQVLEEIKPETAEKLAAEAEARGLSIDEYLKSLLPPESNPQNGGKRPNEMSVAEINRVLDELSEGTEHLPPLPSNFSREDIYSDHD